MEKFNYQKDSKNFLFNQTATAELITGAGGCDEILWLASLLPPQKANVCFCTNLDFPAFGVHGHTVFYPKVFDLCETYDAYMLKASFQTI